MPETAGSYRAEDLSTTLSTHARDLYEDARLVPLLRRLMTASCSLTGSVGSSISIIDLAAGRYTKVAERGTACRLGQSFPLDEGVTGRVMASRRPIVLASYRDVATGHLPPGSRARDGAVAAIPIWWRGDVIGANVVFAGCPKAFTADQIDQLEVVTQLVAPGIVTAAGRDLGMTELFRRGGPEDDRPRHTIGSGDPRSASVAEIALGLSSLVARASAPENGPATPVQVRVVRGAGSVRLQVQDVGDPGRGWQELVDGADGAVQVVLADGQDAGPAGAAQSPFTTREQQVVALLRRGMSDRAIAEALLISPKTAEKHVGAVLRKTGSTSRTAAVVHSLEQGWLAESSARRA
ncbi:GAF domain-containing protein [Blastococcus sp. CT_GayMR19]|uniref:LuxR C-terminal-related transcriptional regulator n=1 Tax=Blastococcus sp. CT_GayMR19 TaxID=2559608 RepID=UPI0010745136|nr:LuxR C-terminal-related transcriptional regulator [Blastococcus sp. CT_GayMR19]TFV71034.1 GAF domain-containing protein [Blastococcus sp. CT_GayMR19]